MILRLLALFVATAAAYVALAPPVIGSVSASQHWNPVGVEVTAGQAYVVEVVGNQTWTDGYVRTTAAGYESVLLAPFNGLKRVPDAPWFALVCCVGEKPETCKAVGAKARLVTTAAGGITCFANDAPFMYWNNAGALNVTVR
mmetsp:Transcript_12920/g.44858  ORF Transcript_12920/g.44858 Transcript_12920/m.44858 type:complete len:142 (-) Transcript_12920:387-812(-)